MKNAKIRAVGVDMIERCERIITNVGHHLSIGWQTTRVLRTNYYPFVENIFHLREINLFLIITQTID